MGRATFRRPAHYVSRTEQVAAMAKHPMLIYVIKRVALYLFTIWGAFTIAFIFFHSVPGDPIGAYVRSMEQRYGRKIQDSEQVIQVWREKMGLDGPLYVQYGRYLKNVFLKFDLGPSFINFPTPAKKYIMDALPWTVGLLGIATIISWTLGLILGGLAGWKRGSSVATGMTNLSLVFSQIQPFFMALALLTIFAYTLGWFPRRGAFDPSVPKALNWPFIQSVIRHGTLPALSLVLVATFGWLISTRSIVVSILGEDYLVYAKAKGLKDGNILRNYVLRNAMLPQVTGLAISLGFILGGAFLVERIFNYPGMGFLFIDSLSQLDYNTVQGIMLMSIVMVLTATLILDLLMPLVDPRVARQGKN
jgi:peptide/nickel transport system permease protein